MKIIGSVQIKNLIQSDKKKAESVFPELIRRLIRKTCNADGYTLFPSGDAIYTTGWDGIVRNNTIVSRFVPKEHSIWELGTNKNGWVKIKSDYEKRKNAKTTFNKSTFSYVAVSSAIIDTVKKEEFCESVKSDAVFKNGCIIDANDIEEWLEGNIEVAIWLLNVFGKDIGAYDIAFIHDEWQEIIDECSIALNPDIFLVGNEANSQKFVNDISSKRDTTIYNIASPFLGNEYAYYFALASIKQLAEESLQDRFIVVKSKQALDMVTASVSNRIVLVCFNCYDYRFVGKNQNSYIFFDSSASADICLNLPPRHNFVKSLEGLNLGKVNPWDLAFIVDYNIIVLKRLFSKIPQKRIPFWAKDKEKSELIPLMFMGEINLEDAGDMDILDAIITCDRDFYIDKLNYWAEIAASPVIKTNSTFRINARKECFTYIKVDVASRRFGFLLKKIEEVLLVSVNNANTSIEFVNKTAKWSADKIGKIIDGLIIVSDTSKNNQYSIDVFMRNLYKKLLVDQDSLLNDLPYFRKLAELSPLSFVRFMNEFIKESGNILNERICKNSNGLVNYSLLHILEALDYCTANDDTANEAFDVYVDLFYKLDDDDTLRKKIIEILSPISTMVGSVCIKLTTKIERFFELAEGQDIGKTKSVVQPLYEDNNNSIMIGQHNSYRSNYEKKEVPITYEEVFDARNRVLTWMLENTTAKEEGSLLHIEEGCYRNSFSQPLKDTERSLFQLLTTINETASEELKSQIYEKTKEQINLLKVRDDDYSNLVAIFENFSNGISISDEYLKRRYFFTNDRFPLDNPGTEFSASSFASKMETRKEIQKKELAALISMYGDEIIDRVIRDCNKKSILIWSVIYELSTDHKRDMELFIKLEAKEGLAYYLNKMSQPDLENLLNEYGRKELIIEVFPYNKNTIALINGKESETLFWQTHPVSIVNEVDFEYIFNKYIEFAPENLLEFFAYIYDYDYQQGIALLNAISEKGISRPENKWRINEQDCLIKIIDDMDKKYYTTELSICEFKLLRYLMNNLRDYPMGIKRFFWDNPAELCNLIVGLSNNSNLTPQTAGHQFYFDSIISISGNCFIPKEYLWQKKTELQKWVETILKTLEGKDNKTCKFVKNAIVNTLACYPRNENDDIWPCVEIADIIESISKKDYDSRFDVSSTLYCSYANRRGARTVNDGSAEYLLSELFKVYSEKYRYSHPVVSKALEYISNAYFEEYERDKEYSTTGKF